MPRVRPGLSGGDAFTPTRPFAWYVFAGADGQAVAYDMLLQASPFRGGPHVRTVWDVAEMQGGFAVMAYGMRLTFAYVAQTQEFNGQTGGLHQFGSASLSFHFSDRAWADYPRQLCNGPRRRKSDRRHNLPVSGLGQHALRSQLALCRLVLFQFKLHGA